MKKLLITAAALVVVAVGVPATAGASSHKCAPVSFEKLGVLDSGWLASRPPTPLQDGAVGSSPRTDDAVISAVAAPRLLVSGNRDHRRGWDLLPLRQRFAADQVPHPGSEVAMRTITALLVLAGLAIGGSFVVPSVASASAVKECGKASKSPYENSGNITVRHLRCSFARRAACLLD